jgi:hypothetical protein
MARGEKPAEGMGEAGRRQSGLSGMAFRKLRKVLGW